MSLRGRTRWSSCRIPSPSRVADTAPPATLAAFALGLSAATLSAQTPSTQPTTEPSTTQPTTVPATAPAETNADDELTAPNRLTLDALLDTQVTLVSRQPERVADAASPVQVLTGEDIQRSGALTLPEALRLAPNLQVAQVNAYAWGISARGMNAAPAQNNAFANKLLVMIDGRSVYNPLFGGVFWDVQNVLLEDVERIEIVSGPGGTLWGSNAVNGVINVVTRSARSTQGLYFSQANGNFWENHTAIRYGGRIGDDLYYRVYGLGFSHDNAYLASGDDANDAWDLVQGGFRMDYYPTTDNTFTLQGDIYEGDAGSPTINERSGGNILGRFTHTFSEDSNLILQMYFDSASRSVPAQDFHHDLDTFDIDLQHSFAVNDRHHLLWGLNYRSGRNRMDNAPILSLVPATRTLELFSLFVQDQIILVPERLDLTLGVRVEHNEYTDWEWQPSARLAWRPTDRQTIWAAVSRPVRAPTRFDTDLVTPLLGGQPGFNSEKVLSYELGYRVQPTDALALSVTGFYTRYDDLRSVDLDLSMAPPLTFHNNQEAEIWGLEFAGDVQINPRWRIRGGYTLLIEDFDAVRDSVFPGSDSLEANDPRHQVVVQSILDLPGNFQFDTVLRYVDSLQGPASDVSAYISLDARLAWHYRNMELAIVGQNLLDDRHPELGPQEIPRSVYGRLTLRW